MSGGNGPASIRVRMYNAGFGDAFLLFIPVSDANRPTRKVLIDCGTHTPIPGLPSMDTIVKRIIADASVGEANGAARIDIVVATHRHLDHVCGFEHPDWATVSVGEVWMPWTENPKEPEARRVWGVQSAAIAGLIRALERRTRLAGAAGREARAFLAMMKSNLPNAAAMKTLYDGFAGSPKRVYLPAKPKSNETADEAGARLSFDVPLLGNVVAHVLGPTWDKKIFSMSVRKSEEYLRAAGAAVDAHDAASAGAPPPFRARWSLGAGAFGRKYPDLAFPREARARLAHFDEVSDLEAAADVHRAVNNSSLMLLFEVNRTARLLFPGDSEWRTWRNVLKDQTWQPLLRGLTFYKVGHHGSRNANPKTFVEQYLGKDVPDPWVMIPTHRLDDQPTWDIPREPLVKALRKRTTRLARADRLGSAPTPAFRPHGDLYVDAIIPIA